MIVVEVGYQKLVLHREKAMLLAEILEQAECYEQKYWNEEERKRKGMSSDSNYTYHVYPNDNKYGMQIISDDVYRMAKLAGKPEK